MNRTLYEALGNNYRVCGGSPEPHSEVYCVTVNLNILKFVCWPRVKKFIVQV